MHRNWFCSLCKIEYETINHTLNCQVLIGQCTVLNNDRIVTYEDVFENTDKQLRAVKLFEKVLEKREELLEKINLQGDVTNPSDINVIVNV